MVTSGSVAWFVQISFLDQLGDDACQGCSAEPELELQPIANSIRSTTSMMLDEGQQFLSHLTSYVLAAAFEAIMTFKAP